MNLEMHTVSLGYIIGVYIIGLWTGAMIGWITYKRVSKWFKKVKR